MLRRALSAAAVLLVLFHAWLFLGHAWQGQLSDPGLLLRWVLAGGLTAALIALRRQGASVFFSRKAVAIWALAFLLHGPALAGRIEAFEAPPLPAVVVSLAQIATSAAALGWVLLLMRGGVPSRPPVFRGLGQVAARWGLTGARSSDARFIFAPRPPPLA